MAYETRGDSKQRDRHWACNEAMIPWICWVDDCVRCVWERTPSATTANPRPSSPPAPLRWRRWAPASWSARQPDCRAPTLFYDVAIERSHLHRSRSASKRPWWVCFFLQLI